MRALLTMTFLSLAVPVLFACGVTKRDYGEEAPPGGIAGMGGGGALDEGDGGASGGNDEPLRILTDSLPVAEFNAQFSAQLEVAGGHAPFTFSVEGGGLPAGVSLTEAGGLRGKPTEDGIFEFTATVMDEAGQTASGQLSLSVHRKRWLAYVADDHTTGQFLLYVLDLRDPLLPKSLLSTEIQPDGDVVSFRFSADGSRLAFTADGTVDGENDLYVVDLSANDPGPARQVNQQKPVGAFALTPDGNGIAYTVQINEEWTLQFVDLGKSEPGLPVTVGLASSSSVNWVTNERVIYGVEGDAYAARVRTETSFSAEESLAGAYGQVDNVNRTRGRVSFVNIYTSCGANGRMLDFETGLLHPAIVESGSWPRYNEQLTYLAFADVADVFIYDVTKTAGDPLGTFAPGSVCNFGSWSPAGNRIMVSSDGLLAVVNVADAVTGSVIGGDYPAATWSFERAAWVSNDHIVFGVENGLYESRIVDGSPEDAILLREVGAADEDVSFVSPAPDGSWIAYVAAAGYPLAIALEQDVSESARGLGPSTASTMVEFPQTLRRFEMPDQGFKWSPDSSRLAYVMAQGESSRLFVADMLRKTGNAVGTSTGGCSGATPETCRTVQAFMFQP